MPESALRQPNPSEMHNLNLEGICVPKPDVRDLPTSGSARRTKLLKRGLLLQCPYCAQANIIKFPFWIKDCCPKCGYRFAPESGYFLGGYAFNLVGVEVIGLVVIIIILLRSNLSLLQQEVIGIGAAVLLPIIFFPWSRTLWMAFDLSIQGDSHLEKEKRPR